ncbi:ABC transporter permease [Undibacterium sp. TJN19]|uniref:ABC transporter permease n=1 Tax=Undibacterium sp. TJN19 TaxID=3413055 RepID=UPI003BF0B121
MFFHLLKPIWKRKFKNSMLSLEILLAFFVVFGLALMSVRYFQLYHQPLGFSYNNVWSVKLEMSNSGMLKNDPVFFENLKRSLLAMPEVEQISMVNHSPYSNSTWRTDVYLPDTQISYHTDLMSMSDTSFQVLDMHIEEGRWFSEADEGAAMNPIVINWQLANKMFPGQSAVGKLLANNKPDSKDLQLMRVTGVFADFRNKGEFMTPTPFAITRFSPKSSTDMWQVLLLKVRPGTLRAFEARLSQQLKMIRNDIGYQISPMTDMRKSKLTEDTIPLMILAVIACFLLVMVAFGLFGVLWQKTTQRIPEIGLRRAVGANSGDIYRQIITEQLLLSSIAMLAGLVFLIQLPITGVLGEAVNWTVFVIAILISMAVIYGISILCSLYPAWRASRLSPTEALHYE